MRQYYLRQDAIGFASRKIYGKMGDTVNLISEIEDHKNTVIAELGNVRFPVRVDNLSTQKIERFC